MAGEIFRKGQASYDLEASGASATDGSAVAATNALDARSGGNNALDYEAAFQLAATFGSNPAVGAQIDLYLVPKFDGTNPVTIDPSSGAAVIPAALYRGSFTVSLNTGGTHRYVVEGVPLSPLLYVPHLHNRTGVLLNSGWVLSVITDRDQYT